MEAIGALGVEAGPTLEESAEPLRRWALANREALRSDAGLLADLGLRIDGGNIVDFGPAALSRLAAERDRELSERQRLELVAGANFAAQAQTHAAAIDLMESRDLEDLARRLNELASARFALAAGVLALEGPGEAPPGWRGLVQGQIDLLVGPGRASLMGRLPVAHGLFAGSPSAIGSVALVKIAAWDRAGLLALGSPDPEAFAAEMGGELVAFLARVVERTASRWPAP